MSSPQLPLLPPLPPPSSFSLPDRSVSSSTAVDTSNPSDKHFNRVEAVAQDNTTALARLLAEQDAAESNAIEAERAMMNAMIKASKVMNNASEAMVNASRAMIVAINRRRVKQGLPLLEAQVWAEKDNSGRGARTVVEHNGAQV